MKIAGVVAEYNPFHGGHEYHIRETRKRLSCDFVVAVMSGAFTQRGEPAIIDKFARAACALRGGVDAVFELPAIYAVRSAPTFARGGVETLDALGVDAISFGCETEDLEKLNQCAEWLRDEPEALKAEIRAGLTAGKTLARARGEGLAALTGMDATFFDQPNLALALEYLKSLKALSSPMQPCVLRRTAPYHGEDGNWDSASALRRAIYEGRQALDHLPESVRALTAQAMEEGVSERGRFADIALYALRNLSCAQAQALPDAGEGLVERLIKASRTATDYETLIASVKCKRYTRARITRLIAAALIGLTAEPPNRIPYLRLIGFRREARPLMTELSRRARLPIAADAASLRGNPAFETEMRATDLWGLTTASPRYRQSARDLREKFLIIS